MKPHKHSYEATGKHSLARREQHRRENHLLPVQVHRLYLHQRKAGS
jgi:hypothetical protein